MGTITWNTDCNAPCCPGEIINDDNPKQTILIQTDWDYPSTARTFGWDIKSVQKVEYCDGEDTPCGELDCVESRHTLCSQPCHRFRCGHKGY
jgi:hypothetical protein